MKDLLSRPLPRLIAVVGCQFLVLLAIIGFKQYTVATADTIVIATEVTDPSTIIGRDRAFIRYEISSLDDDELAGDVIEEIAWGDDFNKTYVELQEDSTGVWRPVAVHDDREHTFEDTVLIAGKVEYYSGYPDRTEYNMRYGIEDVYIPNAAAGGVPTGAGHDVSVKVRVDRFGHADALEFLIDGEPFELQER